jgi:hypothetical protein
LTAAVDHLRKLCAHPESELGRVARIQVEGLRATLQALLDVHPGDPGAAACEGALAELAELAAPPGPQPAIMPGPQGRPDAAGSERAEHQLAVLAADLAASTEARDYLGSAAPSSDATTAALWRWYHLVLLRMPIARAGEWRLRAAELDIARHDKASCEAADPDWQDLPLLPHQEEAVLLPPLTAAGVTGVRLSKAGTPADWAAKAAGLDRLERIAHPLTEQAAVMGTWISRLAEVDDQLNHAVESLAVRDLRPLRSPRERQSYIDELARRLARAADQSAASGDQLRAAVALDEALRSVIHMPPAADKSWWAMIGRTSERLVLALYQRLRSQGNDVSVEVPGVMYSDARRQTSNDIALGVGGEVGQVLAGLRLWARIEGKEYRGRVVYRL